MSTDYDLYLATIMEPFHALQIVSQGFELEWVSEHYGHCLFGSGMLVGANHVIALRQSILEE
ncbi:hypothetical protein [Microcoleus sp. Z1_B5]|uniref:hypothetical protein n=1 Tax=Microcoleus sp. Z1_B5 TaxID=3055430 RepID=UPI002FD4AE83